MEGRKIVLYLTVLKIIALCSSAAAASTISEVDYGIYHHVDELISEIADLVNSNQETMKFEERTASSNGYSASMMIVTSEQRGLSNDYNDKLRVLLSFGQHGREIITTEVGLRFMRILQNSTKLREIMESDEEGSQKLDFLSETVFKILPVENMNGRKLVENGALCERKNGRGVDPNRNWDIDFGVKEPDYDPKEEYPGEHAFSEPEVQMVLKLAQEFRPHVWINVHSGMEALFMPYDHQHNIPQGDDARKQLELLLCFHRSVCNRCVVGSGGKSVGYLAHGTATDYMYEKLHVPLSFTWEIYGDTTATFEDCFKMFNPVTRSSFEDVTHQWSKGLFQFLELLPSHPAVSSLFLKSSLNIQKMPHVKVGTLNFDYSFYATLLLMVAIALTILMQQRRSRQAQRSRQH